MRKLYGNENFHKLLRIRKSCGIRIIGLWWYKYMCGISNEEHIEIQKKIRKEKKIISEVCQKLAHGDEEKAIHYYIQYMKWLDEKMDAIENLIYG